MALRALCMFDGYGGFELGLKLAVGDRGIRTVARVERDSHAAAILVARMAEATLDQAPVWDDVCTFDGRPWAGRVDIITAGFNCQPFSAAGQRRGVDDERWLWADIARIIADVGPRYVFLENVPGLVRHGLPYICADLADLGFDAEWGLLAASDVGAPHRRQRFWLLAWRDVADDDDDRREGVGWQPSYDGHARNDAHGSGSSHVGHPSGERRREYAREPHGAEGEDQRRGHQDAADLAHGAGEDVAQPERSRPERRAGAGEHLPVAAAPGCTAWPPRPDDLDGWERWTAEGGPQPQLRRSTHGRPVGLAESLHAGGNGLVPRVAAEAFAALATRAGIGRLT